MWPAYKQHVREFVKGGRATLVNHSLDGGVRLKDPRNRPSGDPNCELSPQGPIIPVPPSTPLYRPVGICGNNWAVSPGRLQKENPEPEGSKAVVISLVALLYSDAETASGGTRQHQNANTEASFRHSHSMTKRTRMVPGCARPCRRRADSCAIRANLLGDSRFWE